MIRLLLTFTLLFCATQSVAEDMRFDVTLRGIKAAEIVVTGQRTGSQYSATANLKTTGLIGALSNRAYSVRSEGRLDQRNPRPSRAMLDDRSGREQGRRALRWRGGVGRVVDADPAITPQPWSVATSSAGAVDPLSAFWSILLSGPRDQLCNTQIATFDGVRHGRISVGPAEANGDTLTCAARFDRIAGYSPEELAERRSFPFTLTFAPTANGEFRADQIRARTPIGQAVLRRQ